MICSITWFTGHRKSDIIYIFQETRLANSRSMTPSETAYIPLTVIPVVVLDTT